MPSNKEIIDLIRSNNNNYNLTAQNLIDLYGPDIGSKGALCRKLERFYSKKPKKNSASQKQIECMNELFFTLPSSSETHVPPKLAHRPEEKLSSVKVKRSINKKLAPVMSFLQDFCNNEGVTLKNLIQLINEEEEPVKNKKQKTSI